MFFRDIRLLILFWPIFGPRGINAKDVSTIWKLQSLLLNEHTEVAFKRICTWAILHGREKIVKMLD